MGAAGGSLEAGGGGSSAWNVRVSGFIISTMLWRRSASEQLNKMRVIREKLISKQLQLLCCLQHFVICGQNIALHQPHVLFDWYCAGWIAGLGELSDE